MESDVEADICLILEGSYPYVMGGVSGWTHELIKMHDHLSFSIVALVSKNHSGKILYDLPDNVVSMQTIRLQDLPKGKKHLHNREEAQLLKALEKPLIKMQSDVSLDDLAAIIEIISPYKNELGRLLLLDSRPMWDVLLRMYRRTMPKTSFIDYFWSWRGLFGGLFSVLLAPMPRAKAYHALCTGYAGLFLARAHLETGRPCIITEHGIYTNERRIEIAGADYLYDRNVFDLSSSRRVGDRDIKDLWIDTFCGYSKLCYQACSKIITLYTGNQEFQLEDGADPEKLMVIPNGIDFEKFSRLAVVEHSPTVSLIGRVVSIKDIKTYIKAINILKESIPNIRAFVIGPEDEEAEYARECREIVEHMELENNVFFTGKVDIRSYLQRTDVVVLTSISESQPLVLLEAGAAGIPVVATDVGSCSEIVMGISGEKPHLGAGGAIVPLADAQAVASALLKLLKNNDYYQNCRKAISSRVERYYNKKDQRKAYADLYESLISKHEYQEQLKEVA